MHAALHTTTEVLFCSIKLQEMADGRRLSKKLYHHLAPKWKKIQQVEKES